MLEWLVQLLMKYPVGRVRETADKTNRKRVERRLRRDWKERRWAFSFHFEWKRSYKLINIIPEVSFHAYYIALKQFTRTKIIYFSQQPLTILISTPRPIAHVPFGRCEYIYFHREFHPLFIMIAMVISRRYEMEKCASAIKPPTVRLPAIADEILSSKNGIRQTPRTKKTK